MRCLPLDIRSGGSRDLSPAWPLGSSRTRRPFLEWEMARDNDDHLTASKSATPQEEGTPDTVRTRQAVTGHGVRYVLAASLAGIVIAFALVLFFAR